MNSQHSRKRKVTLTIIIVLIQLWGGAAFAYYNPQTGRWLSRDQAGEAGFVVSQGPALLPASRWHATTLPPGRTLNRTGLLSASSDLYAFVGNGPLNAIDVLGLVERGGFMHMNCRQPCEDFRRTRYADMEPGDVPNGAIVCCGGVKFICTWGADKEKNQRAKEIAKRCLTQHERVHIPSVSCDQCANGPTDVKWKKSGKEACEEEVTAHTVSKSCFESALSECGGDEQCIAPINAWIQQESGAIELYKNKCKEFDRGR